MTPNLFRSHRSWRKPWQAVVATLLHYANSSPPVWRAEFYQLKSDLLKKYATFCGHDIQEIRKECWGPWERDDYGEFIPTKCRGETCPKCGGSGVFDVRWVRLQRWEWCGFEFHCPDGDTRIKPENPPQIRGRIEHANYGRASQEAALWLLILCRQWRLLWRALTISRACGWQPWPMLTVQQVCMELSMRLRRRRCWCGKKFWTFGSGWRVCRKCRSCERATEVPF